MCEFWSESMGKFVLDGILRANLADAMSQLLNHIGTVPTGEGQKERAFPHFKMYPRSVIPF